nr:hypothetical protein [Ignavibacteriaceae bacterium]
MRYFYLLLIISIIPFVLISGSNNDSTKTITAYRLSEPIVIDGILSESIYSIPAERKLTQKDPDEGKPATEKSEVWISYDESNIYIGGRFSDANPDSIDATLMRRDNVVESDWIWIYLDPYNDDRTGYFFA